MNYTLYYTACMYNTIYSYNTVKSVLDLCTTLINIITPFKGIQHAYACIIHNHAHARTHSMYMHTLLFAHARTYSPVNTCRHESKQICTYIVPL